MCSWDPPNLLRTRTLRHLLLYVYELHGASPGTLQYKQSDTLSGAIFLRGISSRSIAAGLRPSRLSSAVPSFPAILRE